MSAGWTAARVRGLGLAGRRVGHDGARRIAESGSLAAALAVLESTSYGGRLERDMHLGAVQHAVSATVLWDVRILAGWGPALGAGPLRLLAAWFEIANITGHLSQLAGEPVPGEPVPGEPVPGEPVPGEPLPGRHGPCGHAPCAPYELGSMGTAWRAVAEARAPSEVRRALRFSAWGDPGSEDLASIRLFLRFAWYRQVLDGVPGAADWAIAGAAIALAQVVAAGAVSTLTPPTRRDADRLLGPRWHDAGSVDELARHLEGKAAEPLRGLTDAADLWRAEARWWSKVESEAAVLASRQRPDAASGVGAIALLAADARRVRAALAIAARGGDRAGVLDALA